MSRSTCWGSTTGTRRGLSAGENMRCKGYNRRPHEADHYALGLCRQCYMAQYREEHLIELRAYQYTYKHDDAFRAVNRLYMAQYRQPSTDSE